MKSNIDLAQLLLRKLKTVPEISEYVKVTEGADELDAIPLANLFMHLDNYYNQAATIKSALLFLTEDVGINGKHCILVLAIQDEALCQIVASIVAANTENYYVARTNSFDEANNLLNYFRLNEWACGLIIEESLDGQLCDPIIERCKDLPSCVLVRNSPTTRYIRFLSLGANVVTNVDADDEEVLAKRLKMSLFDMLL